MTPNLQGTESVARTEHGQKAKTARPRFPKSEPCATLVVIVFFPKPRLGSMLGSGNLNWPEGAEIAYNKGFAIYGEVAPKRG